ncbi:MAG TPA: hypothetical protein VFW45_05545 [Candidatus Polarisedimenticolia bacterium]|nr:hypothetical protein [Candidatus Polarisedimenticolia bacterium]
MIRTARVILWLRWRLLLNLMKPTKKRDTLERASRALQVLGPALMVILFLPGVLLVGFLGALAGYYLPQSGQVHQPILLILRIMLGAELGMTFLAPLLRAAQGSMPNAERLILLPIPLRALYISELIAALVEPWSAILASGTLGLALGLAAADAWAAAAIALLAGLALRLLIAALSTLCSTAAQLIFRDRRRGELVSFVLLTSLAILGFMPGLLSTWNRDRRGPTTLEKVEEKAAESPAEKKRRPPDAPGWSGKALPLWSVIYPPELYVKSVAKAADAAEAVALLPVAILWGWALGLQAGGFGIYRRLMETPEVATPRRGSRVLEPRWPRVPWISDAASAVAIAQIRLVLRSVQGKIQTVMLPAVILVLGILWRRRPPELVPEGFAFPIGLLLGGFAVFLAMTTLEGTVLNQFASDRAGLTLEFLSPISDADLIAGKAAAGAILGTCRGVPSILVAAVIAPGGSPWLWLCLPFAGAAVFSLMSPVGAILSAVFPKAVNPARLTKQNQPHPLAAILGMMVSVLALAPVVGLTALATLLVGSPPLALLLDALYTAAAMLVSVPLFRLAAHILAGRRENLALVAQGR